MVRCEITVEDTKKLRAAYEHMDKLIESIEKTRRKLDLPNKPSAHLVEARRLLGEVLYGESDIN